MIGRDSSLFLILEVCFVWCFFTYGKKDANVCPCEEREMALQKLLEPAFNF